MNYLFFKTNEIPEELFISFCKSFNQVFDQEQTVEYFREKYSSTHLNYSYHVFMVTDNNEVVGACTVIPYQYHYFDKVVNLALAVGVFVREDHRADLFSLFKMYKRIKKEVIKDDIRAVIAIPNDVAYPYWKKIVKWKDIGELPYFALPVKVGNVLKKAKFLNIFSTLFSYALTYSSLFISSVFNTKEKKFPVRLKRGDFLRKHRYVGNYQHVEEKKYTAHYTIVNENGVQTAYLIDFYNQNEEKDARSLALTTKHILQNETVDLIIFVGKLNFFQLSFLPIPKSKEPKALYFTIDIFDKENIEEDIAVNFENWDFGLLNYDVR